MNVAEAPAQIQLSQILRDLEVHGKTGLLTVARGRQSVNMYVHQGQLMCIEPQEGHVPLVRRLSRAGVISPRDLQEVEFDMSAKCPGIPGYAYRSEVQEALALTESGLVSHEQLYAWVRQEAIEIFQEPLTWSAGKVSLEEGVQPPEDRLLLALRITSLLSLHYYSSSLSVLPGNELNLAIEELSVPATPVPLLFKKARTSVAEPFIPFKPFPSLSETPRPLVTKEHSSPAVQLPQVSTSTGGLFSKERAFLPLPDYDQTTRLSTSSTRFKNLSTRGVFRKMYKVFAGVILLLLFIIQGALAWSPEEGALTAPSLSELNAAIIRAEQYINQLYKPIDGDTATVAEYYGIPLRIYLTRSHSWILLGESSSTSTITNVENRQDSETFVAEFHYPQSSRSLRIQVNVNWNYDPMHYQIRFANEQFDDQSTSALVYLYDRYITTFRSIDVGQSVSLTFAKTDITHLHSFRYTIRHGNQLAQNYFWYKQDRDKYERLARFLVQQGYQLGYDIYAPIWGDGTSYPDDLPYHISNGDGYEAYHDCHASSWNDTLNYLYLSKVCKVGVGIYLEVSRSDLLVISIQALHILNKYHDPGHSYVDGGNQQSTPFRAAAQLEQKFDQSNIGIPMCSPIGCNYALASGVRTFSFGALETMLGYVYGHQQSRKYADTVARLALDVQIGNDDILRMADGGIFYRPAQKGAFYLSWDVSKRYAQNKPFGYEYLNDLLNMPDEYRGVLVSDMETTFNAYAFLVLYRCKKFGVDCATGVPKPPVDEHS